jgi:hypothetical protein
MAGPRLTRSRCGSSGVIDAIMREMERLERRLLFLAAVGRSKRPERGFT